MYFQVEDMIGVGDGETIFLGYWLSRKCECVPIMVLRFAGALLQTEYVRVYEMQG